MTKKNENHCKRRHNSNRITLWILIGAAILVSLGMLTIAPYMVSSSESEATIRIPKGATMQNVEDTLTKYFGPEYSSKVLKILSLGGFDPVARHGMYVIPAGATPFATMRKLSRGAQTPVRLTINGFRTLPYLAERMGIKMEFSADDFLKAATDSAFLAQYDLTPQQAIGLFLDDTYEVYWTATPREVLDKIGQNYRDYWNEGRKAVAQDLGVTPSEMMILASIVDDETNQEFEKGRIGRLYLNRLDMNMRLQADPTVRYALQDFTIRRVTGEHTEVESPYNTYKYLGLPPGPLRTTSRKTLSAILNSDPTEDLFMCARPDGSGFHNFSVTYEEHLENAKRYHQSLDERGIK